MLPILFHLGEFPVRTYGVLSSLGMILLVSMAVWRSCRQGIAFDDALELAAWAALSGLLGARLLFVFKHPETVPNLAAYFDFHSGGLVFYGAGVVVPVTLLLVTTLRRIPIIPVIDATAAAAPLGHMVARLGCFGAGCCHGQPTDQGWGVTYVHEQALAPLHISLHPTQIYEAVFLGILCVVLQRPRLWSGRPGGVALAYLGAYSVFRFGVEFLRGDDARGWFLPGVLGEMLTTSQGIALGMMAAVGCAVVIRAARAAR